MLTIEDCIAMSDLTQEEVDAIAEHEHLPEMIAVELGAYLIHRPDGSKAISRMILEDIAHARAERNHLHSAKLGLVLRAFVERYGPSASAHKFPVRSPPNEP